MEYKAKDFTSMRFNPFPISNNTDLVKEFPVFGLFDSFKFKTVTVNVPIDDKKTKGVAVSTNKLIRYICYAFDPQSPTMAVSDILQRRADAAKLAGLDNKNGEFDSEIDMIIRSLVPKVNHMIIQFCLMLNEDDYAVIVTYQESLRKQLEAMTDDEELIDTKVLIANANTLRKELKSLTESFFNNNIDYFLTRSLSQFGLAKRLELSPEYFAQVTKEWDNVSRYYKKLKDQEDDGKDEDDKK